MPPQAVIVPVEPPTKQLRNQVVEPFAEDLTGGIVNPQFPMVAGTAVNLYALLLLIEGWLADVKLAHVLNMVNPVTPFKEMFPSMSQSPDGRVKLVTLIVVLFGALTAEANGTTLDMNSPTIPLEALSFVPVPMIPPVDGSTNVIVVAVATPIVGVVNVGDTDPTKDPVAI